MVHLAVALAALIIDRLFGYPDRLYRLIGHPVSWMGRLVAWLDARLNREGASDGRLRGGFALVLLLLAVLLATWLVMHVTALLPLGWVTEALLASSLLAQKSLGAHVQAVADGLGRGIEDGRRAAAQIVGRDVSALDEAEVAKAALESLAENTSDGIIAPLFWLVVAGLPGIALYKAINTADSMIGHLNPRYRDFGWAAARLDDLVNIVPARLTGLLFVCAALAAEGKKAAGNALFAMRRDARKHRSPNAGWPEAALAGALDLKFGGPRAYAGQRVDLATMGEGRFPEGRRDIARGLQLYRVLLNATLVLVLALVAASA